MMKHNKGAQRKENPLILYHEDQVVWLKALPGSRTYLCDRTLRSSKKPCKHAEGCATLCIEDPQPRQKARLLDDVYPGDDMVMVRLVKRQDKHDDGLRDVPVNQIEGRAR